jgi:bifunctional pyridoxal-dependent enzyme with beta-cystathionase and maltose regulon repressor activities
LNTFLFKIIRSEKYKVIAIIVCPLGKLALFSVTKAFNIGGLGVLNIIFKKNDKI